MTEPSVAVLGTGIMGAPMARNLAAAGLATAAWNRSPEKAKPLAGDGVRVETELEAAVEGSDVVLTMLSDADAVASVAEGGMLAAIGPDAVWVQASTVGIAGTARLAGLAREAGVAFVDAPVLGTKAPAEAGELIVLASGDRAGFERSGPAFEAVAAKTLWLGESDQGTRMKLVLNSWLLALTAGLGESIALAEALDLDPAQFLEIIDGAPMGAPYAQMKGRMMLERSFDPSFPLGLASKDAGLVVEAATAEGLTAALGEAIARSFREAEELGHGDADMAAVSEAARRGGG